jgi:hypothetical protein
LGEAVYLTSLQREAKSYGYGKIVKVEVRLDKPLYLLSVEAVRGWFNRMTEVTGGNPVRGSTQKEILARESDDFRYPLSEQKADKTYYAKLWREKCLSEGIDGLVVKGWDMAVSVVAFEPEKSLSVARNAKGNPGKTYADLLAELSWLGPASVLKIMFMGNTRQCGEAASTVAQYLIEQGFSARTDAGSGQYCSHFDLAVHTTDRGWISVDPTAIQFHAPNNISHALDIAERELNRDLSKISDEERDKLIAKYFEPTILWSVAGMLDGTKAFELRLAPHVERPPAPSKLLTPEQYHGYSYTPASWRKEWENYRNMAENLARGVTTEIELLAPRASRSKRPLSYWIKEVGKRIRGRTLSGTDRSAPAASVFPAKQNPAAFPPRYWLDILSDPEENPDTITVQLLDGDGGEHGAVTAHLQPRTDLTREAQLHLATLAGRLGKPLVPWIVHGAYLAPGVRSKGIGTAMYERLMSEISSLNGALMPQVSLAGEHPDATSYQAKMLWNRLSAKHKGEGWIVAKSNPLVGRQDR